MIQLGGWGAYTNDATVRDTVLNWLGDHADDFDVAGVVASFSEAINLELESYGIALFGNDFYQREQSGVDVRELIREAIEVVDLGEVAKVYDRTAR
jgi:hypothetical protein